MSRDDAVTPSSGRRARPPVRVATIADVARYAGVSPMTVSRVVNDSGRVSPQTRERVGMAMNELQYIPNRAARSLVVKKTDVLALVIPDISNPFFPLLARGAEAAAREAGYTVILSNTDEDLEAEWESLKAVFALRVDGVMLAPCSANSFETISTVMSMGVPIMLIDRTLEGVAMDVVRGESRAPARELTDHLISHGHYRVALITGPELVSTARERELGYCDAMYQRAAIADGPRVYHAAYTREAAASVAQALLSGEHAPTAIVTGNNFQAFGVIDAARRLGKRVPEDLAVVTFDDVEIAADAPFLTCAAQPAEEMGRAAAQRLIARLKGDESPPREIVLPTEVRIRRSCGCM